MTVLTRPAAAPAADTGSRSWWVWPALLAAGAGLARLPFLGMPLAPDEGGYLVVADQWHPGTSTYGDYFVDRPPLLIGLFRLADLLGGAVPLRLIGIVAVVASVLLAGRLGGRWAAAVAAILLTTPLFGTTTVDGELLAVPFVLAGAVLLVRSNRPAAAAGAGVCAACAVLIKQNMLDVLVLAAVLLAELALRGRRREALERLAAFALGVGVTVGLALGVASARGTSPGELWDALVTFRAQAASVIDAYANDATTHRFHELLLATAVSGAPLVVAGALVAARRPRRGPDLRWAGIAMVAWELTGAALGGSYWLHYLVALVPGVVVLVAATVPENRYDGLPPGPRSQLLRWAVGVSALTAAVAWAFLCLHVPGPGSDQEVSAYVRAHARAGDTMVVAFGHPNIVHDAGLPSPYPHLWSLSVRVRDPRLADLASVLDGPRAPRWVVVDGGSLATWGVEEATGQRALDQHYREVTSSGDWHVFERI
ncbi:hypothetical protein [Nocardioides mangrovi]|uniref:Glycosyltransferase RgtA/B/C/D-like domain-containing protein n=1 Tax=Nocardioides mangrovi TaxID=2874580 RepID=A0ABS7U873_9ACTN|nr:hypothetical protein [Nocardioides mangrovi]MBZ5737178.1 hypothetical protein [Nocardioides mangrovi]